MTPVAVLPWKCQNLNQRSWKSNRPIEEIETGDYVWSEDTETGETVLKQVTGVSVTMTDVLVRVTTEDGTTINTTENHPFYVERKGWCAAAELQPDDVCRTKDGQTEVIADVTIEQQEKPVKVYNLTIEGLHTYYVSVDEVLVHNDCDILNRKSTGRTEPTSLYEDLAMRDVMSDPLAGAEKVDISMSDPTWFEDGWIKMQRRFETTKGIINIHFIYNELLDAFDDFKFKNEPV